MAGDDIDILVIGLGSGKAVVWTRDLTHGYIAINADYEVSLMEVVMVPFAASGNPGNS